MAGGKGQVCGKRDAYEAAVVRAADWAEVKGRGLGVGAGGACPQGAVWGARGGQVSVGRWARRVHVAAGCLPARVPDRQVPGAVSAPEMTHRPTAARTSASVTAESNPLGFLNHDSKTDLQGFFVFCFL